MKEAVAVSLKNLIKKLKGFSLIEVMIAFLVFSIGILAILGIFPTIARINHSTVATNQALLLAQEKIDEIFAARSFISTVPASDNPKALTGGYRRWWGEADPGGNVNLQQIRVQCVWVENGRSRSITLTTLVAP